MIWIHASAMVDEPPRAHSGLPMLTSMDPDLGKKRPFGKTRPLPPMKTGMTGIPSRMGNKAAAALNVPILPVADRVPSGKRIRFRFPWFRNWVHSASVL